MTDLNSVGTNTYAASVSAANQFGENMNIPRDDHGAPTRAVEHP